VDCSQLDYISSAGLRTLLVAAKRLAPKGGKIALSAPKDLIKEILDIAGFSSIFPIYRTHEDALAAMR
jgi:anti-anti-sigma factor